MDALDRRLDLLHRLTGSSPLILLALLLFPERSLRAQDLQRATGKSKPTILDALRVLAGLELVQKQPGSGWTITARCRQLTIGELVDGVVAEKGKEFLPLPCSSSSYKREEGSNIDTTTTTGVKIFYPHIIRLDPNGVEAALARHGIFPNLIEELAADEWVTAERVEAWAAVLAADPSIRSLPAVLYTHLRDHNEPPAVAQAPDEDPGRFIRGKYAEFIEH